MRFLIDSNLIRPIPAGCDTIVATGEKTNDGITLFGKNSDREPNEAHQIVAIPAKDHESSTVSCTYIDIPQVEHRRILARGAERTTRFDLSLDIIPVISRPLDLSPPLKRLP